MKHDEIYFISYQGQLVRFQIFKGTHTVVSPDKTIEYLASDENALVAVTKNRELILIQPDDKVVTKGISARYQGVVVKVAICRRYVALVLWEEEMRRGKYVLFDRELKFLDEFTVIMSKRKK